ncbi:MAG: penicillin acylase family protein [Anaerolineales bacterium]
MNAFRTLAGRILGKRLPVTSGTLTAQGISQPVAIHRDNYGVPYIKAETERDALYALGFCQGQDRAFQIEHLLRITRHTLSELIGSQGIPVDRLSARIGFHRAAANQFEQVNSEDKDMLGAFAAGVNAGVHIGCPKPAHEFALLRAQPTPFEPSDVLSILNLFAFSLSSWPNKINRYIILQEYGLDAVQALETPYPEWLPASRPVGIPSGSNQLPLAEDIRLMTNLFGPRGASNNWTVDSSRTRTGRPLLANDPHLGPSIPPPWYLTHLQTPSWTVAGASLAGTPFITTGHNQVAAWGVTAGSVDNVALYIEDLKEDSHLVREGDRFVPCDILPQKFHVKGEETIEDKILITPRGPIFSDVLDQVKATLSMQATWMKPHPFRGMFDIYRVQDFEAFQQAWANWYNASLNMVYADASDNIGWQLIGEVPKWRKMKGTIPIPGWDQRFHWEEEPVPFDQMPSLFNPGKRLVATANNKPTDQDDPYLGFDFTDGYRYARIVEALDQKQDWTLAEMAALQMDLRSIPWREMREALIQNPVLTEESQTALDLLTTWDGTIAPDSPAAAVYEFFLTEMLIKIVEAKTPGAVGWVLDKPLHPLLISSLGERQVSLLSRLLRAQPQGWFQRSWPEEIDGALTRTIHKLQEGYGPEVEDWAWGKMRPLTLQHPFGGHPRLGSLFNRGPFPWGGDSHTISQARRSYVDPLQNPSGIANLRMVLDVGNWDHNLFVLAGGQSGNPFSPHYDDQLSLWKRGEGITVAWTASAVAEKTQSTLHIHPDG